MDLSSIPIIDHHAHLLHKPAATARIAGFLPWFTESVDPEIHYHHVPNSLFFRTAIRWLAEILDCEPAVEAVLDARAQQPYEAWVCRLFDEAKIGMVLCDTGYQSPDSTTLEKMQELVPCPVMPILRLETLAESLIRKHTTFDAFIDDLALVFANARANGYVALKSIVAYRSGLDIGYPSREEAMVAFNAMQLTLRRTDTIRLESKPLCDYLLRILLEEAATQQLPVQIHTGFGDRDADLRKANPLHLRSIIEAFSKVQFVLLHAGWPYHRELAHLASIYGNVWLDLSLAIPFATTGIPNMLRDIIGMAPFSKLMFATDAFTMPEIYWLACRWGRWGLSQVLQEFVHEEFLSHDEAWEMATAILAGNASRLYNLGSFS